MRSTKLCHAAYPTFYFTIHSALPLLHQLQCAVETFVVAVRCIALLQVGQTRVYAHLAPIHYQASLHPQLILRCTPLNLKTIVPYTVACRNRVFSGISSVASKQFEVEWMVPGRTVRRKFDALRDFNFSGGSCVLSKNSKICRGTVGFELWILWVLKEIRSRPEWLPPRCYRESRCCMSRSILRSRKALCVRDITHQWTCPALSMH